MFKEENYVVTFSNTFQGMFGLNGIARIGTVGD